MHTLLIRLICNTGHASQFLLVVYQFSVVQVDHSMFNKKTKFLSERQTFGGAYLPSPGLYSRRHLYFTLVQLLLTPELRGKNIEMTSICKSIDPNHNNLTTNDTTSQTTLTRTTKALMTNTQTCCSLNSTTIP